MEQNGYWMVPYHVGQIVRTFILCLNHSKRLGDFSTENLVLLLFRLYLNLHTFQKILIKWRRNLLQNIFLRRFFRFFLCRKFFFLRISYWFGREQNRRKKKHLLQDQNKQIVLGSPLVRGASPPTPLLLPRLRTFFFVVIYKLLTNKH